MKMGEPHVVALPWELTQMLKRRLETSLPGGYVFCFGDGKPCDDTTSVKRRLNERCGFSDWNMHDFRRLLSQIYAEPLKLPPHIAEATLAHVQPGVNRSYNQSTYLDERFEATRRYAEYLKEVSGCSMMGTCDWNDQSGAVTVAA